MDNKIPQARMDELLADVMVNNVSDMRSLLSTNGVVSASSLTDDDTRRAFLKAVKDSNTFRNDLASYLSSMVQKKATFVNQPSIDFVNQPMLNLFGADDVGAAVGTTSNTVAKTTEKKGSFWDTLGGLASKENLQNLFNAGLNVASTSLQNKANKESEERALELERLRLQQLQAQKDLVNSGGAAKKGLSTGAIIGIGVGVIALTTVIILVTRKKK